MNCKEIIVRSKFKLMGLKIPKISDRALNGYRNFVRGNKEEEEWLLRCKLLRNWNLGKQYYKTNNIIKKSYGNLSMTLDRRTNTISVIWNNRGDIVKKNGEISDTYKEVDLELKEKLNKIIGV